MSWEIEDYLYETADKSLLAPPSPTSKPSGVMDRDLEEELKRIPDKLAFKIGEVADLLGVKPYVLRYWESEFHQLKPKKAKNNQRMYEHRDVESLMIIKKLLYKDRYSIEGAKQALKKLKRTQVIESQGQNWLENIEELKERVLDLKDHISDFKKRLTHIHSSVEEA